MCVSEHQGKLQTFDGTTIPVVAGKMIHIIPAKDISPQGAVVQLADTSLSLLFSLFI